MVEVRSQGWSGGAVERWSGGEKPGGGNRICRKRMEVLARAG